MTSLCASVFVLVVPCDLIAVASERSHRQIYVQIEETSVLAGLHRTQRYAYRPAFVERELKGVV